MATLKLDLGAGLRPTEGFKSVDIVDGADYVVDLFQYPWPFKDRSVREVVSNHFIEHIPHYRPEYNGIDGFWMFFNELHRVCTKNAICTFTFPYFKNDRAFYDPSHTRYISEVNFNYLNPHWLLEQGLDHYPITAHFVEAAPAQVLWTPQDYLSWNAERQQNAVSRDWNTYGDLLVKLKAIK